MYPNFIKKKIKFLLNTLKFSKFQKYVSKFASLKYTKHARVYLVKARGPPSIQNTLTNKPGHCFAMKSC